MLILKKIKNVVDLLKTKWSEEPAARGAAKMALGAALLVEGIFGVVQGSRSTFSLFGSFMLGVGAVVFTWVGLFMSPDPYHDEMRVQGKISEILEVRDADGKHAYKSVYAYTVNDQTYSITSSISSSKRPTLGAPTKIVYSASEPRNAYREDGADGWFAWLFIGSGIFLTIWASVSLLISLLLIGGGVYLLSSGRKDRLSVGQKGDFIKDLLSLMKKTRQPS